MLHIAGLSRTPPCSTSICSAAKHAAPQLRPGSSHGCHRQTLLVEKSCCWQLSKGPSRTRRQFVTSADASLQSTFQPLVSRDLTATVLAALGAYVWVRVFDWMATHGVLEQVATRARTRTDSTTC